MKQTVVVYCRVATEAQLLTKSRPQRPKMKTNPSKEAFLKIPLIEKPFDFCSMAVRLAVAKYL